MTPPSRTTGLVGLLSFGLIGIASFIAPPLWEAKGTDSTGGAVVALVRGNSTRVTVSLFVYSLAIGLFLCFVAGLWNWFREHDDLSQVLPSIFALAGTALSVLILAGFVPIGVLGYRSEPASIASLLGDLTFGLLALSGIPTAACMSAYAVLVMRSGALPKWTAYLAAISSVAHVLIAASFLSHGSFLSLESKVIVWVPATFFLWIFATSAVVCFGRPMKGQPGS